MNLDIIKTWHSTKNEGLLPENFTSGSRKLVWWLCDKTCVYGCNHEWQMQIRTRKRQGCPFCSHHQYCVHETIKYTHPAVAAQWNYEKNKDYDINTILPGSDKKYWWICNKTSCDYDCKHEWEASVNSRCSGNTGCPFCNLIGLRKVCIHNSIVTTHPDVALLNK
jgi:hypothetical protein